MGNNELQQIDELLDHLIQNPELPDDIQVDSPVVQKFVQWVSSRPGHNRVFEYLATMNHELRTPLNAVLGYSELILDELEHYEPEALKSDVERIQHAGRHLLGLIEEVINVSRLESGASELRLSTVEVTAMLKAALPEFGVLVQARNNQLDWAIAPQIRLRTDVKKLIGVLRMLVQRASRVTQGGRVWLEVMQDGEHVLFHVNDTGARVAPEDLAQTFRVFDSGHSASMATAFHVAQLLGGQLGASSSSEGTRFTLRIPAFDRPTDEEEPMLLVQPGEQVVLVIDDDPSSHDLVSRHLADGPCRVVSAFSGPEALRIVELITPDVIALEVVLPSMDGWEVLSRLKSMPRLAAVPVVMMSMLPDVGGKAVDLGANAFLNKPFDRSVLLDSVAGLVGETRKRVLVVDDEPDAREIVRRILLSAGHVVDEVPNGVSALAYLRRQRPDLILLDLMMPEMDGFEVIRELQGNVELAAIPLVVLTGMSLSDEDRRKLASTEVIQKGTGNQSVLERLDAALASS